MVVAFGELPLSCRPENDLASAATTKQYVVAVMPRTGSNLLTSHLRRRGVFGSPWEYLIPQHRRHWIDRAGSSDVLPFIKSVRTSPNGTFGVKVQHHHLSELVELEEPATLLATKFVLLTRRDVVAQATSYWRALQTRAWTSQVSATGPASYDWDQIDLLQRQIAEGDAGWRVFTQALGLETLALTYEDLVEDMESALRRIAAFIDVDLPPTDLGESPIVQKQTVLPAERWEGRFVAETRARLEQGSYPARPVAGQQQASRLQLLHRAVGQPVPARWIKWARAHVPRGRPDAGSPTSGE